MAERRTPLPGAPCPRRGYQDWQVQQGIPERDALAEARRREQAREDARRIKDEDGFDADLFFGEPARYVGRRTATWRDADDARG